MRERAASLTSSTASSFVANSTDGRRRTDSVLDQQLHGERRAWPAPPDGGDQVPLRSFPWRSGWETSLARCSRRGLHGERPVRAPAVGNIWWSSPAQALAGRELGEAVSSGRDLFVGRTGSPRRWFAVPETGRNGMDPHRNPSAATAKPARRPGAPTNASAHWSPSMADPGGSRSSTRGASRWIVRCGLELDHVVETRSSPGGGAWPRFALCRQGGPRAHALLLGSPRQGYQVPHCLSRHHCICNGAARSASKVRPRVALASRPSWA